MRNIKSYATRLILIMLFTVFKTRHYGWLGARQETNGHHESSILFKAAAVR